MNQLIPQMADEAIISISPTMRVPPANESTRMGLPSRDEAFEKRAAAFSSAMHELRKVAITLNEFDLRVALKWKKDSEKMSPDEFKFPPLPRYVSDDVERIVIREEAKQRRMMQAKVEAERKAKEQAPPLEDIVFPPLPMDIMLRKELEKMPNVLERFKGLAGVDT